ncbi:hypothetical protein [Streptomyces parvus]|uniref:hypothetical protein n=1 Tax=Streptomyces parvus TaxID=66428 RepID=UPI002100FD84|nr:hypothetical protein [Streptomyces parvus]MCQ1577400.1 hypothetical protein [Streptomyces parvus]
MRRCRYRGEGKAHVQHVLTATAVNIATGYVLDSGGDRSRPVVQVYTCTHAGSRGRGQLDPLTRQLV